METQLPLKRGTAPIVGPCLLWPNGWMDQDATWYKGRPRPSHIVLDEDRASPPKRGTAPQFSAHVYCGQMSCRSPISATDEMGDRRGRNAPPFHSSTCPNHSTNVRSSCMHSLRRRTVTGLGTMKIFFRTKFFSLFQDIFQDT